jgi:hypothetical protein
LHRLSAAEVAANLCESLPNDWKSIPPGSTVDWVPSMKEHPSQNWLESLWLYLESNFHSDLSRFEGLPLVPVSIKGDRKKLGVLSKRSKVVFADSNLSVSEILKKFLQEMLKVCWLDERPPYLHHWKLDNYFYQPNSRGILRLLCDNYESSELAEKLRVAPSTVKQEFCSLFSEIQGFDEKETAQLRVLPIFQTRSSSTHDMISFSSLSKNHVMIEPEVFLNYPLPENIPFLFTLIGRECRSTVALAENLGCSNPDLEEFLSYLISSSNLGKITVEEQDQLMIWILKRLNIHHFTPGINVIKLFMVIIYNCSLKAKVFVSDKLFQPKLIVVAMARAYCKCVA